MSSGPVLLLPDGGFVTTSSRSRRSQSRVDRVARASVRVAIVVVFAALGLLVAVSAAHASTAGAEKPAGVVQTVTRSR